jgi:4'-phosphopantetheinyl transferase EntD
MENNSTLVKLKSAAASMAPGGCAFECAAIGAEPSLLSNHERALIKDWAMPRQKEFTAGRLAARGALATLGRPSQELLRDGEGLPLWPSGVVGSITHCRNMAAAAVRTVDGLETLIGLDLEKTNRLSNAASQRVLHPMEVGFAGDDQVRASILFSLKEAFYKAQFPRWRTTGNFHDIALDVDLVSGGAKVCKLGGRFTPELVELRFRFRLVDDYVLSFCW